MATVVRLSRGGSKKRPFYQIVVADSRTPRDGRFIEKVGTYNPMLPADHPERIRLKEERVRDWLSKGAQPTERVARFLGQMGVMEPYKWRETPKKSAPGKKALERAKEQEEKAAALKAAAEEASGEASAEPAAEGDGDAA